MTRISARQGGPELAGGHPNRDLSRRRPWTATRQPAIEETIEIPAMPNIGPSEQFAESPYSPLDAISPTIGWQFRPQKKGGPAFMILRRSPLGMLKAVETFPLTEDGWPAPGNLWSGTIPLPRLRS
jgi:hypothetical protein